MRHGCWGLQFPLPVGLGREAHCFRISSPNYLGLPDEEGEVAARGNAWTFPARFDLFARQAFNELPASHDGKFDTAFCSRVAHNRLGFTAGSDRREVLEEALPHHDDAAVAAPKMLAPPIG